MHSYRALRYVSVFCELRLTLMAYCECLINDYQLCQIILSFFTARRSYASAVLGVIILSVRPSVCHTHDLWLIQRTYRRYLYTIWKGNPSSFLVPKGEILTESPPMGAPNRGGIGENGDFRPISGYISQTVQNRDIVTMER